jgi:hypothetical protein
MGKPKPEKGVNPVGRQTKSKEAALSVPEWAGKTISTDKTPEVKMLGTRSQELRNHFIRQSLMAYGLKGADKQSTLKHLHHIYPAIRGINPQDELEGMLSIQMVGVHNVVMECLGRAMFEGQTFEAKEANICQATKLLRTFTAQMEALQKYRGKSSQQKVTVEHVHVYEGGQAIVGAVNPQGKGGGGGDDGQS